MVVLACLWLLLSSWTAGASICAEPDVRDVTLQMASYDDIPKMTIIDEADDVYFPLHLVKEQACQAGRCLR
jgi:hypothetical protein